MKTFQYKGKNHRIFELDTRYGHEEIILAQEAYVHGGGLAVEALCFCTDVPGGLEPYAFLTVNLGTPFEGGNRAFLDTNNNDHWGVREFLEKEHIASPVGVVVRSGHCEYPLYEFDTAKFTV